MNYSYNEILFLDFNKAKFICKRCRAKNQCDRTIKNKNKILELISKGEISLFILNNNKPKYKECSCALVHFDKPCMQECLSNKKDLRVKIEDSNLWTFVDV